MELQSADLAEKLCCLTLAWSAAFGHHTEMILNEFSEMFVFAVNIPRCMYCCVNDTIESTVDRVWVFPDVL